jgi:Na+-translocating ferredoxin:NAD+ oxidoreductase RnfD subunit
MFDYFLITFRKIKNSFCGIKVMENVKKQPLIRWLPNMKKVLYALVPLMLASIYFFGWKSLVIIAISNVVGFLTEYIFNRIVYKEPVSSLYSLRVVFLLLHFLQAFLYGWWWLE